MRMEHAHFHVDFTSGRPVYKALEPGEVSQWTQNAQRVDYLTGQGWFKSLWHHVKHFVVHTVNVVKNDVTGLIDDVIHTGKTLFKDGKKLFSDVGEDIIHGDFSGALKDFGKDGEQVIKDAKAGGMKILNDVKSDAKQLIVLTIHTAEKVLQFVLDHTGPIGEFFKKVLHLLGAGLGDAVNWLRSKMPWHSITDTMKFISDGLDSGIDGLSKAVGGLIPKADAFGDRIRADFSVAVQGGFSALGAIDQSSLRAKPSVASEILQKAESILSKALQYEFPELFEDVPVIVES